jgi:hypothetical protein
MLETLRIAYRTSDEWLARAEGKFLDARHWDYVVRFAAVNVLKPNGSLLLALRPNAIPRAVRDLAHGPLLRAARATHRRTGAAGGREELYSGTIGCLNGEPTRFTRTHPSDWAAIQPLLRAMKRMFRDECPAEYTDLRDAACRTPPERLIPYTVFTSAAVNRWSPDHNARMAVHADDGNLPGAFGALTVLREGDYSGGLLVFPRYRVAVDLHAGDCLIADNREPHGNTAIIHDGDFERVSVVAYYHSSNAD